ncbi:MAG: cytochrome b N-terminal domain-containing protein [Polyangiaceae bacterium]
MKDLFEFVVSAGIFLRNIHRWAACDMVMALVFLHMVRVFFAKAYRPPRAEVQPWVIGVCLSACAVTVLMSYTGYLLPWDQLALWGVQ